MIAFYIIGFREPLYWSLFIIVLSIKQELGRLWLPCALVSFISVEVLFSFGNLNKNSEIKWSLESPTMTKAAVSDHFYMEHVSLLQCGAS